MCCQSLASRRALLSVLQSSRLSVRELASAIGVDASTLERHLSGRSLGRTRASWYRKLRAARIVGGEIHLVVAYTAPTKKQSRWAGSRATLRDKK